MGLFSKLTPRPPLEQWSSKFDGHDDKLESVREAVADETENTKVKVDDVKEFMSETFIQATTELDEKGKAHWVGRFKVLTHDRAVDVVYAKSERTMTAEEWLRFIDCMRGTIVGVKADELEYWVPSDRTTKWHTFQIPEEGGKEGAKWGLAMDVPGMGRLIVVNHNTLGVRPDIATKKDKTILPHHYFVAHDPEGYIPPRDLGLGPDTGWGDMVARELHWDRLKLSLVAHLGGGQLGKIPGVKKYLPNDRAAFMEQQAAIYAEIAKKPEMAQLAKDVADEWTTPAPPAATNGTPMGSVDDLSDLWGSDPSDPELIQSEF